MLDFIFYKQWSLLGLEKNKSLFILRVLLSTSVFYWWSLQLLYIQYSTSFIFILYIQGQTKEKDILSKILRIHIEIFIYQPPHLPVCYIWVDNHPELCSIRRTWIKYIISMARGKMPIGEVAVMCGYMVDYHM